MLLHLHEGKKHRGQGPLLHCLGTRYAAAMSIQAPRTQDYPWLATLLTKRVKRIDSGYDLKIHRQILKNIPAQVVLIPRKAQ